MKILITEWKAWMKWLHSTRDKKLPKYAENVKVIEGEVELLPEKYISYTEYRQHIKSQTPSKRVYRRKRDERDSSKLL